MSVWTDLKINEEFMHSLSSNELKSFWFNEKFEMLYANKKYDRLNLRGIKIISKTKLKLSQKLVNVLRGKKIAVEVLAILKSLGGRKKWVLVNKLFAFGFKKSSVYSTLKFLRNLGLIFLENQMIKMTEKVIDSNDKNCLIISGSKRWKIFLLFGLNTLEIFNTLCWKARASKLAKNDTFCTAHKCFKNDCMCGNKILLQNKYFMQWSRYFIYSSFKKIVNIFNKKMSDVFKTIKSWKWFNNGKNYFFDINKKFCFEFQSERYLILNIF